MSRSLPLAALAVSAPLALAALVVPGRASDWVFALVSVLFPVALMALGAAGGRRSPGTAGALLVLLAVLAGSVGGVLALSGRGEVESVTAFPVAAVVQVVGLWLLPLPLATLAYALTFDRTGLTRRDLEALRERAAGPPEPGPAAG